MTNDVPVGNAIPINRDVTINGINICIDEVSGITFIAVINMHAPATVPATPILTMVSLEYLPLKYLATTPPMPNAVAMGIKVNSGY